MGYYIETPSQFNKAQQLIGQHDAERTTASWPPPEGKVLICVVQNAMFDVAAIAYDQREMEDFNSPTDYRPKTWLLLPRSTVIKLCPSVEKHLA